MAYSTDSERRAGACDGIAARAMARLPRIFGKKRGHRRTGSEAWGSFGEGVFHGLLVCAGLVFAALLISGVAVPEWRINHDYLGTTCRVVGHGLVRRTVEDPPGSSTTTWRPALRVRYTTRAGARESWARVGAPAATRDRVAAVEALAAWPRGTEITGWYDPAAPGTVVLVRGYNWWMWLLALLLPGALLAFGGSGLLRAVRRWGRSEEAIAATAGLAPLLRTAAPAHGHPAVPECDNLVNSPGTILRYRLPIESAESWTLLGLGLFAVLWNAVLVVLAVNAGIDFIGGRVPWLLMGLLLAFLAVGVAGIVLFVRGLVFSTAVGTTQLEISDHPLRPGRRYEVLLGQGGAGTFLALEMTLELEEQATFRQGTDARCERLVVWQRPVAAWRELQVSPGTRFEGATTVEVPADAMHSFASEHNAVRWRLVIRGAPARWPSFVRVFPVVVFPEATA